MLAIEDIWKPATQQRIFRRLMMAMAHPGEVHDLADLLGDSSAVRGVLATLIDNEVRLADPNGLLSEEDWPLLRAGRAQADSADYVLCDGAQTTQLNPRLGTLESPERSATLVVVVRGQEEVDSGQWSEEVVSDQWLVVSGGGDAQTAEGYRMALVLSGPGIREQRMLVVEGLHPQWLVQRDEWTAAFPFGVDVILVDPRSVSAIPRTTKIENTIPDH